MRRSFFILCLTLLGCSQPFRSISSQFAKNWSSETLKSAQSEMTGYVDSTMLNNYKSLDIDTEKRTFKMAMPIPNLLNSSWQKTISEIPGAEVRAFHDQTLGGIMELTLPLEFLLDKTSMKEKTSQIDGRLIPGANGMRFEKYDIPIPEKDYQLFFFKSDTLVGMLVQVPYDPLQKMSIAVKNKNPLQSKREVLGYIHTMPKEGSSRGGFFLLSRFTEKALGVLTK